MNYLGYNYYYKKNLQGDIIEIWGTEDGTDNHTFRCLVKYVYDAWGNILQMNDTTDGWFKVGTANPFRYRGYYYDTESGFYYLQSRYYDPVTGRFLNADAGELSVIADSCSSNLFAYCLNNPVNMFDLTGESPANIIGGIIGGVAGAALGYLLAEALGLKDWKKWALIYAATVGGAVLGAFLGPYIAKLGGKIAVKLGIKTAASQTIKMSSSKLWKGCARHIFSKDHIKNGIMRLGGSQKAIFNKIYKIVKSNLTNAVNGSNQIHATINGIKVTIRFYVLNGEVQSINAMLDWATRIIGKLL